jgi:hypothetical protein
VGSCKETALYLAFFAERNALQQKDQNRDSRLKRYCYLSATSKPCLAQLVKLRTAFKSYSSAEAVRSRDFSKYTELSTAYGLYSSAGFEENAKIAFVNLPLNAYTGLVDILVIGKRASEGDPEALLQLDLIVANFQQSVLHPIDSISTSIKDRLEEADQYEANGDINRAQQIRSSIFIEATLSVTGVFATSKMIFNFPEGRFGVGAEAKPNVITKISDDMKADPYHPDWQNYNGYKSVGADVNVVANLKQPNKRHNASSVSQKTVAKDKNTVIEPNVDVQVMLLVLSQGRQLK